MTDQEQVREFESFLQAVGKPPKPGEKWGSEERARMERWIAAGEGRREWLALPAQERRQANLLFAEPAAAPRAALGVEE